MEEEPWRGATMPSISLCVSVSVSSAQCGQGGQAEAARKPVPQEDAGGATEAGSTARSSQVPVAEHPAERWCTLLWNMIVGHRWSARMFARKMALKMAKKLDWGPPRGLAMQGQRWGWREVGLTI